MFLGAPAQGWVLVFIVITVATAAAVVAHFNERKGQR